MSQPNRLYYGDNLEVLRRYINDESVDLIYLDPPFNSRRDYNVLFAENDRTRSSSLILALQDTWEFGPFLNAVLICTSKQEFFLFSIETETRYPLE